MYLIHRASFDKIVVYKDGVLISKKEGKEVYLDRHESEFIEQARSQFADYIHNGRYWTLEINEGEYFPSWVSYSLETKLKQARLLTFYGDIVNGSNHS